MSFLTIYFASSSTPNLSPINGGERIMDKAKEEATAFEVAAMFGVVVLMIFISSISA